MDSKALISRFSIWFQIGEHCIKTGITYISNAGQSNFLTLDRNIRLIVTETGVALVLVIHEPGSGRHY